MPGPIITLTTDLGHRDHYSAVLKGAILSKRPKVILVDISHHIHSFDIVHAAYVVQNGYKGFPEGSIHVVTVDNSGKRDVGFICLFKDGHYFIAPDNGLFSLIFPREELVIRKFDLSTMYGASQSQCVAEMVDQVIRSTDFSGIGQKVDRSIQRIGLEAVIQSDRISGVVIHVDHFGNLILNVRKKLFEQVGKNRPFSLYFRRFDPICSLSEYYSDVPVGETLCRFNEFDYLEIAINMGRASDLLGLKVDDTIQVDFDSPD